MAVVLGYELLDAGEDQMALETCMCTWALLEPQMGFPNSARQPPSVRASVMTGVCGCVVLCFVFLLLLLQVKDMAAKTEQTVAVDSLVDELKQMLSATSAAATSAADGAAAAMEQLTV